MRTVVITDGDQRAALATVRSLGRAGYRCVVTSGSGRSISGASRHAHREAGVPDPGAAPEAFAEAIDRISREERAELVVPITESAAFALLPHRETFAARIPFPAFAAFQSICDKGAVLSAATELGIRVPRQRSVATATEAEEPVEQGLTFPVVLKPHRSVFRAADGSRTRTGVRWAYSADELRSALAAYPDPAYPVLVQEAVRGPGIGVFALLHEGQVLARFAHRRIREKPPSGGVSVLRQSEPMDPELLERSIALLKRFDWSGVAMVEYKRDERTGEAVLMEINGRFWGSLQLAVDAGVDFPGLLAAVSFGEPVTPVETYGFVRSRWFWGDVDHVIGVLRDERSSRRDRLAAIGGWARAFGPGYRSEVFRWTDPRPFLRESIRWFADLTHR